MPFQSYVHKPTFPGPVEHSTRTDGEQVGVPNTMSRHPGLLSGIFGKLHGLVTADGFNIEVAAQGLYELIGLVLVKTGAHKVNLLAHSMGGLVARCMMQKLCGHYGRKPAPNIVARLFIYGGSAH